MISTSRKEDFIWIMISNKLKKYLLHVSLYINIGVHGKLEPWDQEKKVLEGDMLKTAREAKKFTIH